jgi:PRTRC genetic system protein B
MTRHYAQFEAAGGGLALSTAILLYRGETTRRPIAYGPGHTAPGAFASIHTIEKDANGTPTIGVGSPLTRAHLRQWAEALGRSAPPEILPANVLVAHADILAWWTPAQVRCGYFALTTAKDLKALSKRTIAPVPYPAHVFIATRSGLGVYALPSSERPTADAEVLHSPILNVFLNGQLCWGNIPKPRTLRIADIAEFERAVFDSWSTHPNAGQDQTVTGRGGLVRLWDDLATRAARHFPVKRLRPFSPQARRSNARAVHTAPITLGDLIAARSRR